MYGYESWTMKKAEHQRIDAFELWCWRRLLRVPWTARRSDQSILKEISPEYSCWSWSSNTLATWCEELTHWKRSWCWERLKAGIEGMTEDEVVGWHHRLNGHEFEWTPGDSEGQEGLACCSPFSHKESDMTEWLNWTDWQYCYLIHSPHSVYQFWGKKTNLCMKTISFCTGSILKEHTTFRNDLFHLL